MPEIFIENVTLKIKFNNEIKAIRTAINEFIGYVKNIEKKDNFLFIELDVININIYCIEKDFYKLVGIPKEEFQTIKFIINLNKNYIDTSIIEKDSKIAIKTAVVKRKEVIEDDINILKEKIFVIVPLVSKE